MSTAGGGCRFSPSFGGCCGICISGLPFPFRSYGLAVEGGLLLLTYHLFPTYLPLQRPRRVQH